MNWGDGNDGDDFGSALGLNLDYSRRDTEETEMNSNLTSNSLQNNAVDNSWSYPSSDKEIKDIKVDIEKSSSDGILGSGSSDFSWNGTSSAIGRGRRHGNDKPLDVRDEYYTIDQPYTDTKMDYTSVFGFDTGTSDFNWNGTVGPQSNSKRTEKSHPISTRPIGILTQVKKCIKNLEKLEAYLQDCKSAETVKDLEYVSFSLDVIKDPTAIVAYPEDNLKQLNDNCIVLVRKYAEEAGLFQNNEDEEDEVVELNPEWDPGAGVSRVQSIPPDSFPSPEYRKEPNPTRQTAYNEPRDVKPHINRQFSPTRYASASAPRPSFPGSDDRGRFNDPRYQRSHSQDSHLRPPQHEFSEKRYADHAAFNAHTNNHRSPNEVRERDMRANQNSGMEPDTSTPHKDVRYAPYPQQPHSPVQHHHSPRSLRPTGNRFPQALTNSPPNRYQRPAFDPRVSRSPEIVRHSNPPDRYRDFSRPMPMSPNFDRPSPPPPPHSNVSSGCSRFPQPRANSAPNRYQPPIRGPRVSRSPEVVRHSNPPDRYRDFSRPMPMSPNFGRPSPPPPPSSNVSSGCSRFPQPRINSAPNRYQPPTRDPRVSRSPEVQHSSSSDRYSDFQEPMPMSPNSNSPSPPPPPISNMSRGFRPRHPSSLPNTNLRQSHAQRDQSERAEDPLQNFPPSNYEPAVCRNYVPESEPSSFTRSPPSLNSKARAPIPSSSRKVPTLNLDPRARAGSVFPDRNTLQGRGIPSSSVRGKVSATPRIPSSPTRPLSTAVRDTNNHPSPPTSMVSEAGSEASVRRHSSSDSYCRLLSKAMPSTSTKSFKLNRLPPRSNLKEDPTSE